MSSDFYTRNGYYPRLYVNGDRVADNIIHGSTIQYSHSESDDATLIITLIPGTGAQDLNKYQGKSVVLDVQTSSGIHRVFTGIVDIDEYDILKERIVLRCTDNRANRVNALSGYVKTIGHFSADVFGKTEDTNRELENRLSTIPYAFDFDGYGNYYLTPWTPKSTADFTYGNSDVYRRDPVITRTKRADILNTVNVKFEYAFPRLHHREVDFSWASGISACNFLIYGHSLCAKEMVRRAANAVGWPLKTAIGFTPLYASGMYRCSTTGGSVDIGWTGPTTQSVNYAAESEGVVNGQSTNIRQADASGNYLTAAAAALTYETASLFCIGAGWTATKRFTQTIVESYSVTVTAPQSVTQYGSLSKTESFAISDKYDPKAWEDYHGYTAPPSGAVNVTSSAGGSLTDYYIDKTTDRYNFNLAIVATLSRAKTDILRSHRQNRITFETDLKPELDLRHTVALNCTKMTGKGKVTKLEHYINVGTSEAWSTVEISLYQSQGSGSDTAIGVPTAPSFTVVKTPGNVQLGSHYGVDPTTTAAQSWNGHIGNKWIQDTNNLFRTYYPESFIVDTPAIEASFREQKTLLASSTYNVALPNNAITVTFSGKLS